jgi:outer membrane receptor protein involved in Fe transport
MGRVSPLGERSLCRSLCFALFMELMTIAFIVAPSQAQVTGATLSGTVTDPSGAAIPQAQVSIRNVATGVSTVTTTNTDGFYSVPNLLPGSYELTVTASGFATAAHSNITLAVGEKQVLPVAMSVGQSTQTVVVNAAPPAVELATSTISGEVTSSTVRELPLNGRDWTQLATLQPGVVTVQTQAATGSATVNRGNRGFGTQLTDSGHNPYENLYRVNGISINDYTNGAPGSVLGVNLGVDAIEEFSVLTTDYTAEYGMSSGMVVNSITKSGSNGFHGDAYWFLRDKNLDARNYFDAGAVPPFHRNQYGASAGGPLIKNRTFWFVDYEGITQDLSAPFHDTVPSAAARAGSLCSVPSGSCTPTTITVSPLVTPYLGFWPLPNGGLNSGGDTGFYNTEELLHLTENYVIARIDHRISGNDNLNGSWFYDRSPQTQPDPLGDVKTELFTDRQMGSLEETHVFNPSLVNTVRVGFNRSQGFVNVPVSAMNPIAADTSLGTIAGRAAPIINIGGITPTSSLGSASHTTHALNSFQFYDDAFLTKGKHSLKFGFAYDHEQYNVQTLQSLNGTFSFGSLENFLLDEPSSFKVLSPASAREDGFRQTAFGAYLQDDWHFRPNLTVNLGLRYEPTTLPSEANNLMAVLPTLGSPAPIPVQTEWANNQTLRNWEPRIGFSWDPFHDGKMAVRGGFGIFDLLPLPWIFGLQTDASYPTSLSIGVGNLPPNSFPTGAIAAAGGFQLSAAAVKYVAPPKTSFSMNWNLNIQREITPNLTATIAYVGSRSNHLPNTYDDINFVLPTNTSAGYLWPTPVGSGAVSNPNVGDIHSLLWDNNGFYHGLQIGALKKLSHGFQVQGSYNWSRCIDYGSGLAAGDPFTNSLATLFYFDPRYRRGLCDYNIDQAFSLNYVWDLPRPRWANGFASQILGGWELGGILTVQSGTPFTPLMGGDPLGEKSTEQFDTPDRISGAGCASPVNSGSVADYLKLSCFTPPTAPGSFASSCAPFTGAVGLPPAGQIYCANLLGNVNRNSVVGPGLLDLDFSAVKNFPITKVSDVFSIQFRSEFFNILNHSNFASPIDNSTIFNQNGSPVPGAGTIDSTTTTNREIQFALKVIW